MLSTFNLARLTSLLKDFYTITRIRITVFNDAFEEIVSYPPEKSDICLLIRKDARAKERCAVCDEEACATARRQRSTHIYRCHAGLTEAISPIVTGELVIGYLFFGHVFSYSSHEEGWEAVGRRCEAYDVDPNALKDACFARPLIDEDYILSASHLLHAVAVYLCLERMATLRQEDLGAKLDRYIAGHLGEALGAKELCEQFHIGKTLLYDIAKKNYGTGVAEHIRALRLEKAKRLLAENPKLGVEAVASLCGFNDYTYFITLFKKAVGVPPGEYRRAGTGRKE